MNIQRSFVACLVFAISPLAWAQQLDEVVIVTSRLRESSVDNVPSSTTVLPAKTLERAGLAHFGDVVNMVPNLNWASGTARPRYFQLRGIGELEQYQGAPNPSVGFLIDDIDFSGVGMPATTFDVEQIEVLRGPQGTAYGANALAGLISVRTREATTESTFRGEVTGGDHDTYGAGVVLGGALAGSESAAFRVVAQHYESDGFRRNVFLGRDDTNGYDESTLRAKLRLEPSDALSAQLTLMYVDIDDGYDGFSVDNSRITQSDDPGRDEQRSTAAALRLDYSGLDAFSVRSTTTWSQSDIFYSFDGDWGNDAFWGVNAPYDYTSAFDRRRRAVSQDVRLLSPDTTEIQWLVGAYVLDVNETNAQEDAESGFVYNALDSVYDATNVAAYAQVDVATSARSAISFGLRGEQREARYRDSNSESASPEESMWGGHLSYTFSKTERHNYYLTLSRGYKAGGFSIGAAIPASRREFSSESLWNVESGSAWQSADGRWSLRGALFYMDRQDLQVSSSEQLDPGDPLSYVFYTDNAASGSNYGFEGTISVRASERFTVGASLGLLESEYQDYRTGDPIRDAALDGREQTHAPSYQYAVYGEFRHPSGFLARADVQGLDDFFFSASHEQHSSPYQLVHLKLGYEGRRWSAFAWARNVFDERYSQRGFFFRTEPPDFPEKRYVQLADGRQLGVTVAFDFQ